MVGANRAGYDEGLLSIGGTGRLLPAHRERDSYRRPGADHCPDR